MATTIILIVTVIPTPCVQALPVMPPSPWSCCTEAQLRCHGQGQALASQGWTFYWDMGKPWHWNKKVIFLPKVQAVGLSVL